ncbi:unnamed protein product [Gongylonema pulchrum]|uniref:Uncharacterized protein n=1 Tax=Gongylonema pulchrum TaxID=637853 RepID=A0A183ET46_9BILA|nr:unnamed protein product [Gongylonema pulchrum]
MMPLGYHIDGLPESSGAHAETDYGHTAEEAAETDRIIKDGKEETLDGELGDFLAVDAESSDNGDEDNEMLDEVLWHDT